MSRIDPDAIADPRARGQRLLDLVEILRERREDLARRKVARLWIFGSVARGEERQDSDVDIIVEFEPGSRISLTAFARLQLDLTDWLGRAADLAEWSTLRPHITEGAKNDAVSVF
jgi:predicted nucleotidyltransferase